MIMSRIDRFSTGASRNSRLARGVVTAWRLRPGAAPQNAGCQLGTKGAGRRPPLGRGSVLDASVINRVAVTARTDTDRAVIAALTEDREGIPVGAAVVQAAIGTEKRCQLRVDPAQCHRVGRVAADDLLDC